MLLDGSLLPWRATQEIGSVIFEFHCRRAEVAVERQFMSSMPNLSYFPFFRHVY